MDQAGLGRTMGIESRDLITLIPPATTADQFFPLHPIPGASPPILSPTPKGLSFPKSSLITHPLLFPLNYPWVNIPRFIPRSAASIHPHRNSNSYTKLLFWITFIATAEELPQELLYPTAGDPQDPENWYFVEQVSTTGIMTRSHSVKIT